MYSSKHNNDVKKKTTTKETAEYFIVGLWLFSMNKSQYLFGFSF